MKFKMSDLPDTSFNGIFYQYDWTEFAIYIGGAFVIYLLVRISNKQKKTQISKS